MADAAPVVAVSNGQGAVDNYNAQVASVTANIAKMQALLADLVANPVVLHD